jgi:hypothetical protein
LLTVRYRSPPKMPASTTGISENTLTLDDVFGAELDRFPLEQDAMDWEVTDLDWDDEEAVITEQYAQRND